MHALSYVSSQLLASVLFIAVPTNTEKFKIFIALVCVLFLASGNILMCWGALLRDAGSLKECMKPCVTFEGSRTKKQ